MLSPAHGQIIVHGENHDFLFQQKPQVPDQRAFSRAGGSVEQDDAPAPRSERFPFLRRRFFPVQAESASFLFPSRRVFPRSFMAFRTARGGVLIAVFRPAGSGPFHKGGGFLTGDAGWFPEDVGRGGHGRFMGIMNKKIRQGNHKNGSVRTEPPPFVACRAGPGGEELLTERAAAAWDAVRHDSVGHAAPFPVNNGDASFLPSAFPAVICFLQRAGEA